MNRLRTIFRFFAFGAAVLAGLGALLYALALTLHFDTVLDDCRPNLFSTLLYIILALMLGGTVAFVLLARLQKVQAPWALTRHDLPSAPTGLVLNCLLALAFAAAAVWEIKCGPAGAGAIARLVSAALAVLYFLLTRGALRPWLGFAPIAWAALTLGQEYLDWTIPMNSQIKLSSQFALLALMLFMITELQTGLDIRRPIRHTLVAAITLWAGGIHGLATATAVATGAVPRVDLLIHSLPPLALASLALWRLWSRQVTPAAIASEEDPLLDPYEEPTEETAKHTDEPLTRANEESILQDPAAPAEPQSTSEEAHHG